MTEITNHESNSIGGLKGHLARRFFHISLAIIPWLYYAKGEAIGERIGITPNQFVSIVLLLAIVGEYWRLRSGVVFFGQRSYESTQISALCWGAIAMATIFLIFEDGAYGYPLIWSLTFVDPLLGELRRSQIGETKVLTIGIIAAFLIWLLCYHWYATPLLMVMILPVIVVLSEKPRLDWIDDNAMMLLIPGLAVLMLENWI